MKLSYPLGALLLVIATLTGCSKPQNNDNSTKAGNAASSTQAVSTADANFSKVFAGTINSQYPIEMNLQRNGENLAGTYTYTKYKIVISIKGKIDGQDNFIINEFDSKGNPTGVFKGRLISNTEMEGIWSKPNGEKSMPFSLNAIGGGSEVAATTRPAESVNTTTAAQPVPTPEVSRTELTRQTVLSLAQGRIRNEVVANLDDCSNCGIGNVTDVYAAMMKDKVIACREYGDSCLCWRGCTPGQNGRGLRKVSRGMDITLGYSVPTEVTGISRINPTTAYADIVVNFQPNDLYRLFNKYRGAFSSRFGTTETHRVFLRLYDDGWRFESWQ